MARDERVAPESAEAWGRWLTEHHARTDGVWVVLEGRSGASGGPSYEDLVLEALCWGWVDGQAKRHDDGVSTLWFSPRRSRSPWAATNKARVEQLSHDGRLRPPGIAVIEAAKANGMWTVLDGPEAGIEPPELTAALDAVPAARTTWDAYPPSARKFALTQIALAVRPETRSKRIADTVAGAARGERP